MRPLKLVLGAAAIGAVLNFPALEAGDPAREEAQRAFYDRYAVVIERNIFSRDRPRRVVRPWEVPREAEVRRAEPPPEDSLVLRGVVREGGVHTAFVEDLGTGKILKLKAGEAVARGRITAITIDGIVYERGEERTTVDIGRTLSGRSAAAAIASPRREGGPPGRADLGFLGRLRPEQAAPTSSQTSPPEATSSTGQASESGGTSEADIIERMRQRRLRESQETKS